MLVSPERTPADRQRVAFEAPEQETSAGEPAHIVGAHDHTREIADRKLVKWVGDAGTAYMTPSERQKTLVVSHVVCSATRGSEDFGPNRKSRLKRCGPRA